MAKNWNLLRQAAPLVAGGLAKDLGAFCRAAWPHLHPGAKLRWTWHMDLLCEYLTLAQRREIRRLILNVPPRTAKTSVASIMFPVWCWLSDASLAFLCASYELDLAESHNLDRRRLISSSWFQSLFADRFRLSADRSLVGEFTNASGGAMVAVSVGSKAQGRGGDICIVDDPLSADAAYSDIFREQANQWFQFQLPQRLNDPATTPIVLIQQRLHQSDPTGFLLEHEPGDWTHIRLPLIAEEDERWEFPISRRVVVRRAGECLDPKRFPPRVVAQRQRNRLVWASQFEQRPAPLEGNMIRTADLRYFGGKDPRTGERDAELPARFDQKIISVDCSFKDKSTSDYVAILTIGVSGSRRYVLDVVNAHLDLDGTEAEIRRKHVQHAPINAVLVEDKANGSAVIGHLKENLAGVIEVNPEGGKVTRMVAASPEFQAHDWHFDRNAAWCDPLVEQLTVFPNAKHDDMADALSQASIWLQSNAHQLGLLDWVRKQKNAGFAFLNLPRAKATPTLEPVATATPVQGEGACCENFLKQWIPGGYRCGSCGRQFVAVIPPPGPNRNNFPPKIGGGSYGRFS